VRAAKVFAPGDVRIVEVPVPRIGPGEILVDMKAVGLCGSDATDWYVATKAPAVLGHETAGVVAQVGPGVTGLVPGDRVFVHHHVSCGRCRACLKGDEVVCPEWRPTRLDPGGLAEKVRVDALAVARDTLKIPANLGLDDASLVEPVACAVKAVARGEVSAGDSVLVVGLGSNGVLLSLLARRAGALLVLGSDPDAERRRLSARFGVDVALDPRGTDVGAAVRDLTGGRGADVVFVIPTAPEAALAAVDAAAPGGRVVFYSPVAPSTLWPLRPNEPYFRGLTLAFSYSCGTSETRRALALLSEGVVRARDLYTHRLPLDEAAEGFRLVHAGGAALKVLITM
jgi:L-iditol 2-dehydrogenase